MEVLPGALQVPGCAPAPQLDIPQCISLLEEVKQLEAEKDTNVTLFVRKTRFGVFRHREGGCVRTLLNSSVADDPVKNV